ncbi:lysylphosphatidylglycerol synthase transmembrane domain-containing protein [Thomasclavelia saccharogumia]|uniref:lysylphosphatidylglycerol synthase transmembrane domain-containing protein n=1 Tax=Thomasclavelia saccharogumia TaxID=341225 RepID=UPI00047B4BE3|nr:lysylphosphatidylglycerol synthase transmembrane domain-containing protein [Thomasclavelia saccharogumia]
MDKKSNKKYIFNILLILVLGTTVIYLTMKDDLQASLKTLMSASPMWILFSFILMGIYYILDGLNLYTFGRLYKKDYRYKQGFVNAISGTFFNGITPFSSGGQFAQVYIFNRQGIQPTNSASILLMAFIVYQSVLVLFTAIIMIFKYRIYSSIYSEFFSLAIIGFLINFFVIAGLFLGAKSKKLQNFICNNIIKFLSKIHIVKNYTDTSFKVSRSLENFREELNILQHNKNILIKSSIVNLFKLIIIYSIPFFAAKALHIGVSIKQLPDFIGICSFVYMITAFVPIPGASGGSEGVYFMLFSPLLGAVGTPTTMLIWRFITYYLGLIIGGLIFAVNKEINGTE